ncbi:MAG: hypothetical protein KC736_04540, partial [Candidatus Moranbacteria bacterium]|nr:hypothetical protein [Candidatus Moranbacteria bacterium]
MIDTKTAEAVFRFDDDAIDILKARTDFALEIDFVDLDEVIEGDWTFSIDGFPSGIVAKKDDALFDGSQLGIILFNPHELSSGKEYTVQFHLEDPIEKEGRLKLNMDLSVYWKGSLNPLCAGNLFASEYKPRNYFTLEIEQFSAFWYYPQSTSGVCWDDHVSSSLSKCVSIGGIQSPGKDIIITQNPDPKDGTPYPVV